MRGDKFYAKIVRSMERGRLHPKMVAFLKAYLKGEKAIEYRKQWVINTHCPPYPSRAFDGMLDQMSAQSKARRLVNNGLFAMGVSLDSIVESEHDTLRGHKGAFRTALRAMRL